MPRRHGWRKEGVAVPSPVTAAEGALPADDVLARLSAERQACRGTKRTAAAGGGPGRVAPARGTSPGTLGRRRSGTGQYRGASSPAARESAARRRTGTTASPRADSLSALRPAGAAGHSFLE